MKDRIAPIFLQHGEEHTYGICWEMTENGEFITKTAYNSLNDVIPNHPLVNWKLIGKLRVPQRIRLFLWVLLHVRMVHINLNFKFKLNLP